MEEKKQKKAQKSSRLGFVILAVILLIVIAAVAFGKSNAEETAKKPTEKAEVTEETKSDEAGVNEQTDDEEADDAQTSEISLKVSETPEEKDKAEGLSFPYMLDDGKLEVTSIFQFSGMNPDCDGENGDNIAALTLKNLSDKHMASADVTSVLEDGTAYHFKITDIPAGKTVMAFSAENASYENDKYWKDITCTAEYIPLAHRTFHRWVSIVPQRLQIRWKRRRLT